MFIQCPECATKFVIKAEQLGEGRKVRCSVCRYEWFQYASATKDTGIPDIQPLHDEHFDYNSNHLPVVIKKRKFIHHFYKWGAIVLFILLAIAFLLGSGQWIVTQAPVTQPVFQALGIFPTDDVKLDQVRMERTVIHGKQQLNIRGSIQNLAADKRLLPSQFIQLYSLDGKELAQYVIPTTQISLQPAETYVFHHILPNIPAEPFKVVIDIGSQFDLALHR